MAKATEPQDIIKAALYLVRGQERRTRAYREMVDNIINRTGTPYEEYSKGKKTLRAYLPRAKGTTGDPTASAAEAIDGLEQLRDVQIMRAVDAAGQTIGVDIEDDATRAVLRAGIALNCKDGRRYYYEILSLPGFSRSDFYRRKRAYLLEVARRAGIY